MIEELKKTLSPKRFEHSMGVKETAISLARYYGADEKKAEIAAVLHDCAKGMSIEEQLKKCRELKLVLDEETLACPPVIHAPLGACIARCEYGIDDEEILNAICYHTVGRVGMSDLEKIIYVADMIEPTRDYDGVEELRKNAYNDLDTIMLEALNQCIIHNVKKGSLIHTDTIKCRNDIIERMKEKNGR